MKDSQGNLVLGRTRWRRFAAVVIPSTIAVSALMGGIASGSVPVALKVSGQTAMLTADKLEATGFSQFGAVVKDKNGKEIPVAASQIKEAKIYNLCQSVRVPGTDIVLIIRGGRGDKPVYAKDLMIGMNYLAGDAVFKNIDIGTADSALSDGGTPPVGLAGNFGQEADFATIHNLNQRFYSTHAGEFHLTGMSLNLKLDGTECFTVIKD